MFPICKCSSDWLWRQAVVATVDAYFKSQKAAVLLQVWVVKWTALHKALKAHQAKVLRWRFACLRFAGVKTQPAHLQTPQAGKRVWPTDSKVLMHSDPRQSRDWVNFLDYITQTLHKGWMLMPDQRNLTQDLLTFVSFLYSAWETALEKVESQPGTVQIFGACSGTLSVCLFTSAVNWLIHIRDDFAERPVWADLKSPMFAYCVSGMTPIGTQSKTGLHRHSVNWDSQLILTKDLSSAVGCTQQCRGRNDEITYSCLERCFITGLTVRITPIRFCTRKLWRGRGVWRWSFLQRQCRNFEQSAHESLRQRGYWGHSLYKI